MKHPARLFVLVATFAAAPFQHVGYGGGPDAGGSMIFNTGPWAMFSTGATGSQLQARTHNGGLQDINLGAAYLGTSHRYRIDWGAGDVKYYIDGTLVHTAAMVLTTPMRPAISDFTVGGATLSVDWIRAGTFGSRRSDGSANAATP